MKNATLQSVKLLIETILLLSLSLFVVRNPVLAQADACTVQVYYDSDGKDQGDCLNPDTGLCRTKAYALQQGLRACSNEVIMLSGGLVRDTYRAPKMVRGPLDWVIAGVYWLIPMLIGVPVGWCAARWLSVRKIRRAGGKL